MCSVFGPEWATYSAYKGAAETAQHNHQEEDAASDGRPVPPELGEGKAVRPHTRGGARGPVPPRRKRGERIVNVALG